MADRREALKMDIATLEIGAIRAMEKALLQLAEKESYCRACAQAPQLMKKESSPSWFLRFSGSNHPEEAARRLANYWTEREKVFGARAFKPIMDLSGNGALSEDDVKILQTGYILNLPRDKKNRTVLYYDRSKRPQDEKASPRILFFALQTAMFNEASRNDGFVVLINASNPFGSFNEGKIEMAHNLIQNSMPIKVKQIHVVCRQPGGQGALTAPSMGCLGSYFRPFLKLHVEQSGQACLDKLSPHGLSKDGLPVPFGGTWSGGEPWGKGGKLVIEADINCLVRNALWSYGQSVANHNLAKRDMTSDNPTSTSGSASGSEDRNRNKFARLVTTSNNPTSTGGSASDSDAQKHLKKPTDKFARLVTSADPEANSRSSASYSEVQAHRKKKAYKRSTSGSTSDSEAHQVKKKAAKGNCQSPTAIEDAKAKKRRMNIIYAQRKREKERIEVEVYQQRIMELNTTNINLKDEHLRLQGLARAANDIARNHESEALLALPAAASQVPFGDRFESLGQSFSFDPNVLSLVRQSGGVSSFLGGSFHASPTSGVGSFSSSFRPTTTTQQLQELAELEQQIMMRNDPSRRNFQGE